MTLQNQTSMNFHTLKPICSSNKILLANVLRSNVFERCSHRQKRKILRILPKTEKVVKIWSILVQQSLLDYFFGYLFVASGHRLDVIYREIVTASYTKMIRFVCTHYYRNQKSAENNTVKLVRLFCFTRWDNMILLPDPFGYYSTINKQQKKLL